MILTCKHCSIEFKTSHKSANYCSRSCRNKAVCSGRSLSEAHKTNIKVSTKGITNVGNKNAQYGKRGELSPTYGTTRTLEVKARLSELRIGKYRLEDNPNWKGGKSVELYSYTWTNELKTRIRKRDKFTCYLCGNHGHTVHHIDYNKENCVDINLITLCHRCHPKTNFNRNSWEYLFNETIRWVH